MRKLLPLLYLPLALLLAGAAPSLMHLALGVTTTNMGLTLPSPGVTPGPTWASQLVTALTTVDAHDHTSGKGVKVPVAGLNINEDLDCGSHGLTSLDRLELNSTGSASSGVNTLYELGGELYFCDGGGNCFALTAGGGLNVSLNHGINGQYATDPSNPSAYFTTSLGEYTFTTNGTALGSLRTARLKVGVNTTFANLTITDTDQTAVLLVDSTAAARTITLPSVVNSTGRVFWVKDRAGTAATHNITVQRAGSATIDGATTKAISTAYGSLRLVSDGVNWFTL